MAERGPVPQPSDADIVRAFAALTREPVALDPHADAGLRRALRAELAARRDLRGPRAWVDQLAAAFSHPWPVFGLVTVGLLLAVALGGALLVRLYPTTAGEHVATLQVAAGEVQIQRSITLVGDIALTRDLEVSAGNAAALRVWDQIQSDPVTEADIAFVDGSRSSLGPDTQLRITRLQARTASEPLAIAMNLSRGSVRSDVAELRPDVDEFRLSTPNLVAQVKGTIFRVDVSNQGTRVATDEGVVQVRWDGNYAEVPAGEELVVLEQLLAESMPKPMPQAPQLALGSGLPEGASLVEQDGEVTLYTNEGTTAWQIQALPGALVHFYVDGELANTVEADGNGLARIDFTPPGEGSYQLSAVTESASGERSLPAATHTLVLDLTPPPLLTTSPTEPQVQTPELAVAGITEPGASLRINGQDVAVAADGSFQSQVRLVAGANDLMIEAADQAGNTVTLKSVIVLE